MEKPVGVDCGILNRSYCFYFSDFILYLVSLFRSKCVNYCSSIVGPWCLLLFGGSLTSCVLPGGRAFGLFQQRYACRSMAINDAILQFSLINPVCVLGRRRQSPQPPFLTRRARMGGSPDVCITVAIVPLRREFDSNNMTFQSLYLLSPRPHARRLLCFAAGSLFSQQRVYQTVYRFCLKYQRLK